MSLAGFARFAFDSLIGRHAPLLPAGTKAPDFEATDQHGKPVRLSDYRGRKVVLWFFPKADTPG